MSHTLEGAREASDEEQLLRNLVLLLEIGGESRFPAALLVHSHGWLDNTSFVYCLKVVRTIQLKQKLEIPGIRSSVGAAPILVARCIHSIAKTIINVYEDFGLLVIVPWPDKICLSRDQKRGFIKSFYAQKVNYGRSVTKKWWPYFYLDNEIATLGHALLSGLICCVALLDYTAFVESMS